MIKWRYEDLRKEYEGEEGKTLAGERFHTEERDTLFPASNQTCMMDLQTNSLS